MLLRRDAIAATTRLGRCAAVLRPRVRSVFSSSSSSLPCPSSIAFAGNSLLPQPHHHRAICRQPPLSPRQTPPTYHYHYSTLSSTPSQLRARSLKTHRSPSPLLHPSPCTPFYNLINPIPRTFATMAEPVSHSRPAGVERLADRVDKPLLDDRSYRVVKLPNQLEVLLIHDADTDKASAAMDVNVGSFSDVKDLPGIAHAVEHLLFMGTEKVRLHQIPQGQSQEPTRLTTHSYSTLERTSTTPT
jgi:hypothetical protein